MANRPFLLPALSADNLLELQRLMRVGQVSAAVYRRCRLLWELAAGCNHQEAAVARAGNL